MDKKIETTLEGLEKINNTLYVAHAEPLKEHKKIEHEIMTLEQALLEADKVYDKKKKMYA